MLSVERLKVLLVGEQIEMVNELSLILEGLYKQGSGSFDSILAGMVRKTTRDLILSLGLLDHDKMRHAINELLNFVKQRKLLVVRIAIEPSMELVETIRSWLVENLAENVVLYIRVSESLLAGLQIEYGGKFFDTSLLTKLNSITDQQWGEIAAGGSPVF